MLCIKQGATLHGLVSQMAIAVIAAHAIYEKHGAELVLTSGDDGNHQFGSAHYDGRALDLRTRNLEYPVERIAAELRAALGSSFQVLVESDHIHLAYRPL